MPRAESMVGVRYESPEDAQAIYQVNLAALARTES